jgi:ribosomal protein L22
MHALGRNIGPQKALIHKVYNIQLRARNIENECAHRNAHFQEKLESLKVSVAYFTSLLEQALKNASSKGLPIDLPLLFKIKQQLNLKK